MQAVAPGQLIAVIVAATVITVTYLVLRWAAARRSRRRARGVFVLGFSCGLLAGAILRRRGRARRVLGTVVRLRRPDRGSSPLVERGFTWVREQPYNR